MSRFLNLGAVYFMEGIVSTFLEIGPGRGDFLFWLATENPAATIAAIEYKHKRYEKLVKRIEKRGLPNIKLYLGDARLVLPQEFAEASLDKIYVLFSDPWPKRKHAKHRLFQQSFLEDVLKVLKPGGEIFIAHDNPNYKNWIQDLFKKYVASFSFNPEELPILTFYAEKWKNEGRPLYAFSYRKIASFEDSSLSLPCILPVVD